MQAITAAAIRKGHALYQKKVPRDLFYRAATELLTLRSDHRTSLTLGESLAVLLLTWNKEYFRFRPLEERTIRALERLCKDHRGRLHSYVAAPSKVFRITKRDTLSTYFENLKK